MFKKFIEFLKSKTDYSSLRLMSVSTVFTCCLSILIVVISEAVRAKADWTGVSIAVTAIGAVIFGVLYGKNKGAQIENKAELDQLVNTSPAGSAVS